MTMSCSLQCRDFDFQFFPAGLDQDRAVGEDDGRHAPVAIVDLHDEFDGFRVVFEINARIGDVVGLEEFPGAMAVGTIFRGIHYDLGGGEGVLKGHGQ